MTRSTMPTRPHRRAAPRDHEETRGVLVAASRDPDAKLTFIASEQFRGERLAVKIPTTAHASSSVETEARMLVALRRLPLGQLSGTVPRYVRSISLDGRAVLVSTALAGSPMSVAYHAWRHTARPASVRRDFELAGQWLRELQTATSCGQRAITWPSEVSDSLRGRWDGHPRLDAALTRLATAREHLAAHRTPMTVVHGDFWFGNVLVSQGRVSGVVDWEAGCPNGSPLRDLARFALSYSLYLDRHARPGHRVRGHRGLRRTGFAPGVRFALLGSGWLPQESRRFLADGLERLSLPRALWYDVALCGIGEVAATANDDDFGVGHLDLLASLPCHPRGRPPR